MCLNLCDVYNYSRPGNFKLYGKLYIVTVIMR